MGHEHWHGHSLKHGLCRTSQDELSQAAVAIAAHDDQIGTKVAGVGQQRLTGT
jgi:hypothetical protein